MHVRVGVGGSGIGCGEGYCIKKSFVSLFRSFLHLPRKHRNCFENARLEFFKMSLRFKFELFSFRPPTS